MRKPKQFYVFIVIIRPRFHVLYTGMTGDWAAVCLSTRTNLSPAYQPLQPLAIGVLRAIFPRRRSDQPREGDRGWQRSKKIRLIESMNPCWNRFSGTMGRNLQTGGAGRSARDPSPRWRQRGASGWRPLL